MKPTPRILFLGYSEVGHECLSLLLERGDNVVALITHEDNPNEKIWFKTPAVAAREHNALAAREHSSSEISNLKSEIPIFTPDSINTPQWVVRIRDEIRPDLILSVYYRNMVSERVLEIPRLGAFNMHGSLLPKYRGRAPINWAVLHGEPRIGMTLHKMVKRADAGDIVDQQGVDISPRDTAEQAFRKVLPCARAVLARQIDALLAGSARATPQDESQATYFGGRKPDDGRIDFAKPSVEIFNLIRAVTDPYPGAFVEMGSGLAFCGQDEPRDSQLQKARPDPNGAKLKSDACAGSGGLQTAGRGAPRPAIERCSDAQRHKGRDCVASGGLETAPPCAGVLSTSNALNLVPFRPDPVAGNARLMVWWAEPDSPVAREALVRDARARRDITPIVSTAPPMPQKPAPGEILSLAPLVVATADGALELTRVEWRGAPPAKPLRVGQLL